MSLIRREEVQKEGQTSFLGGKVTFVMCVVVVVVEVSAVKVWELSRRPVGGLESP